MSSLLLVLGVGLVVFGAIVLIRYSDRPGGTLKWMGVEISSKGAGLPLIALGVASIAFGATRPAVQVDGAEAPAKREAGTVLVDSGGAIPGCLGAVTSGVAAERVATVEVGMSSLAVVSPPQPLDLPVALLLTENGAPIGAVRLRVYRGSDASSNLIKVEEALGADCQPAALRNASRGGDPRNLVNWDTLRLRLGGVDYDLRLGAEQQVEVGTFTRAS